MLVPNPNAVTSAASPAAMPNTVERTGAAVRPRPTSSAIRTPAMELGGNDAEVMAFAMREGR